MTPAATQLPFSNLKIRLNWGSALSSELLDSAGKGAENTAQGLA